MARQARPWLVVLVILLLSVASGGMAFRHRQGEHIQREKNLHSCDTIVEEAITTSDTAQPRQNTSKLLRGKHQIDAALVNLNDFPELQTELRGFREKLWDRFLELER